MKHGYFVYLCHISEYSQNALGLLNHGMNDKIQLHNQNNNLPDLRFATITIRFSASYSQPLFITINSHPTNIFNFPPTWSVCFIQYVTSRQLLL